MKPQQDTRARSSDYENKILISVRHARTSSRDIYVNIVENFGSHPARAARDSEVFYACIYIHTRHKVYISADPPRGYNEITEQQSRPAVIPFAGDFERILRIYICVGGIYTQCACEANC